MSTTLAERALRYREAAAAADWEELASLVAVGSFVQVGGDKCARDWPEATSVPLCVAGEVRRIDEAAPLVFMEIDERSDGQVTETLAVFEFDAAGKLCRLDLFQ